MSLIVMASLISTIVLFSFYHQIPVSAAGNNQNTERYQNALTKISRLTARRIDTLASNSFNYDTLTGDLNLELFDSLKEANPDLYVFYEEMTRTNNVVHESTQRLLVMIKDLLSKTRKVSPRDLVKSHCAYMIFFLAQYYRDFYRVSRPNPNADVVAKELARHFFGRSRFYSKSITEGDTEIIDLKNILTGIRARN